MKKLIIALLGLAILAPASSAYTMATLRRCTISTSSGNQVWVGIYWARGQEIVRFFPAAYYPYCPSTIEVDTVRW